MYMYTLTTSRLFMMEKSGPVVFCTNIHAPTAKPDIIKSESTVVLVGPLIGAQSAAVLNLLRTCPRITGTVGAAVGTGVGSPAVYVGAELVGTGVGKLLEVVPNIEARFGYWMDPNPVTGSQPTVV